MTPYRKAHERRSDLRPRTTGRTLVAWGVAIAIVLLGSTLLMTAMMALWIHLYADTPPILLLPLPWVSALALGWSVRRRIARPPARR